MNCFLQGELTEDDLKEYFGQYGEITDCVVSVVALGSVRPRAYALMYSLLQSVLLALPVHECTMCKLVADKHLSHRRFLHSCPQIVRHPDGGSRGFGCVGRGKCVLAVSFA